MKSVLSESCIQGRHDLKILHTSDWHIGRRLYGRKRYEEHEAFLNWLGRTIQTEQIDILIVAGDIFDTTAPSNRAQELYYRFLAGVPSTGLSHMVVTAGNHDSPSFLNAPRGVLKALNVHVVGAAAEDPAKEVLRLDDADGNPLVIVCAVPYLRDRDVRLAKAGEDRDEKVDALVEGIRTHYQKAGDAAEALRHQLDPVPLIVTGHLFAAGGKTREGDGVRELYVGSLSRVGADIFPENADYVALGHLHIAQTVGGRSHIRYCGSPIPMGFGEAGQVKGVEILEFKDGCRTIDTLTVPEFRQLKTITGNMEQIEAQMQKMAEDHRTAWVEVTYTGSRDVARIRSDLDQLAEDCGVAVLRIRNRRPKAGTLNQKRPPGTLEELSVEEVFELLLESEAVPESKREALILAHREILIQIRESDRKAE